jgi:hypothetical protein
MRRILITVTLVSALLASTPPASAQQEITGSPLAQTIIWRGWSWWGGYGRQVCHPFYMHVYRGGAINALGVAPSPCVIYLGTFLWDESQGWPLNMFRTEMRTELCQVMFHELGHWWFVNGEWKLTPHVEGWIMDAHSEHFPTIGECNRVGRGE